MVEVTNPLIEPVTLSDSAVVVAGTGAMLNDSGATGAGVVGGVGEGGVDGLPGAPGELVES